MGLTADNSQVTLQLKISKNSSYSAIKRKQYGFPNDDYAGQSSDISVTNPQYSVVAVGW
jgi:hypothetical protein